MPKSLADSESPNSSQLCALGFQAGAFCGAGVVATLANHAGFGGFYVLVGFLLGFLLGGLFGLLLSRTLLPIAQAMLSAGRPQTMLIAAISALGTAMLFLSMFALMVPTRIDAQTALFAAIGAMTIALIFGLPGKAP